MTNKKRNFTSFHEQKGVVNKWRDFLAESQECLEEGCPGCEKCLGEGFVTSSVGHRDENLPWPEESVSKEIERAKQLDTDDEMSSEDLFEDDIECPAHWKKADCIMDRIYDQIKERLKKSDEMPNELPSLAKVMDAIRHDKELENAILDASLIMAEQGLDKDKIDDLLERGAEIAAAAWESIEGERLEREGEAFDDLTSVEDEDSDLLEEGELEVSSMQQVEILGDIEGILKDIYSKLDNIDDLDASIDYLAAALTGERPAVVQAKQASAGRLGAPPPEPLGISKGGKK